MACLLYPVATTQKECPSRPLPRSYSPLTVVKPSKSTRKRETYIALRKVSVPDLSPPPVPATNEDWEGTYTILSSTYAGYQHFRERAAFYRKEASRRNRKNDKPTADYRARLCENLASVLGQTYTHQSRRALREMLRKQRQVGHAISESNPTINALGKHHALLMLQAISHIPDDPVVQDWRGTREVLGDWDYLRKAKKELERGVERPYPSPSDALADQTSLDLGTDGMSPGKIRKAVKAQGLPAPSREWTRKRLKAHYIKVTGVTVSQRPPRQ